MRSNRGGQPRPNLLAKDPSLSRLRREALVVRIATAPIVELETTLSLLLPTVEAEKCTPLSLRCVTKQKNPGSHSGFRQVCKND